MRILHLSRKINNNPCTIKPQKWIDVITAYMPDAEQEWVHRDSDFSTLAAPDVVIIHAMNSAPRVVDKVRKGFPGNPKVVSVLTNNEWIGSDAHDAVMSAMSRSDLVIGKLPAKMKCPAPRNVALKALVDASVFTLPVEGQRREGVFMPLANRPSRTHWTEAANAALWGGPEPVMADGSRTDSEMAAEYQRALVVIATQEDASLPYSAVEAILCGAIPVVSDHKSVTSTLGRVGYRAVSKDPVEIREAIQEIMALPEEKYRKENEICRNNLLKAGHTLQAQAPKIVHLLSRLA